MKFLCSTYEEYAWIQAEVYRIAMKLFQSKIIKQSDVSYITDNSEIKALNREIWEDILNDVWTIYSSEIRERMKGHKEELELIKYQKAYAIQCDYKKLPLIKRFRIFIGIDDYPYGIVSSDIGKISLEQLKSSTKQKYIDVLEEKYKQKKKQV